MMKPTSDGDGASNGLSPISGTSKHQMTPLKIRRKLSRKDQGADVHSTCSTPNRFQYGNSFSNLNSPSDSFPCSQDIHPDVIWDYTSPKLPKGVKKKEMKITVDEFLKSLSHNQAPQCNTQNSHYIRLLEKWMAKQNTPVCVKKPVRTVKRDTKMKSRRVFEEITKFMESIQQNKTEETHKTESTDENNLPNVEHSNKLSSLDKKSFLEGDSNENDSIEDLWGEADNSFIVKATQHLDVSCYKYNTQCKNLDIISTIPETVAGTSNAPQQTNLETQLHTDKDSLNKAMLDSDHQAQILLTQIMSSDWESDSDFEDFENGFILGDDALSLIPDEVLCGTANELDKVTEKTIQNVVEKSCHPSNLKDEKIKCSSSSSEYKQDSENRSCEISFGCSESNKLTSEVENMSEIELFNNFEDDSFVDESILCKPEVLSWIEEVESKLSQSQKCSELSQGPKCTPEEIKKKKDEAIQRRKKNQSKNLR